MPTEEHKAAYRRIIEAVNAGDFAALDAPFAADMVNRVLGQMPGLTEFKQWMATARRRGFPDLRGTVGHVRINSMPEEDAGEG